MIVYKNSALHRQLEIESINSSLQAMSKVAEALPNVVKDERHRQGFLAACDELERRIVVKP